MAKPQSTYEKILVYSLNSFSKKGFDGVSVRDIANGVGIKESSVYNHFKNKQDILDTLINEYNLKTENIISGIFSSYWDKYNIFAFPSGYTELTDKLYKDLFSNKIIIKFWSLLTIEQFKNKKYAEIQSKLFFDDILGNIMELFDNLIKEGLLKDKSSAIMALEFYSPIYVVFQRYLIANFEVVSEIEPMIKAMINGSVTAFIENNITK